MATSTTLPAPPRVRLGRWPLIGLVVILAGLLAVGLWAYSIARSALPQLDGTLTLDGLSQPVTVSRDQHGVVTIDAAGFPDLFFVQGYVTASDRLWQMDGMRRFAAGELAEILGPEFVDSDREARILGMRVAARKALEVASPENREHFEAYARGVNAYIQSHRDHLPIEFRILRYEPRPWTPEDSMLIAAQMVKDLNHGQVEEAHDREQILAKLGPELTADLYVNSSFHDRPPTVKRQTLEEAPGANDDDDEEDQGDDTPGSSVTQAFPAANAMHVGRREDSELPALGSNNWVVSGAHTVTGKPLLSNDMHLGHQMPSLWYETHLRSGNFDVVGVSLPGLPCVIVGHNQRIAWGFTNVGPTVEDLYIETFNAQGQYQTPSGWKDPEHRNEIIHVKGRPDVSVDVVLTRHGPIVSELFPGDPRALALRWTLYEGVRNPFFDLNSAQNWDQFQQALTTFDAAGQNVVYADVDGNIGYHTTGKIPIRAAGDGSLPVTGSDDAHEWKGYVPFDKLPSVYNPPAGIIATANGRIQPDNYPYSLSMEWDAPWRTARIYRVLESGKKFSSADMLALQTDILSEFDRFTADKLVYAVDHVQNASARTRQAAELMRGWDGRMTAESAAPLIEFRARTELMRLLLEPRLGSDTGKKNALSWKTYRWPQQSVWLETILMHQPKRWLPEKYATYDELLTAAVDAASNDPALPKDLKQWKWGSYRAVHIQHPILGEIPILNRWTGPGTQPQSGSGYTVKAVSKSHGPSERLTVDLSNLDQTTLNLVTGQGGNFLSPYYMDQWQAWYRGFTFPLPYSAEAVKHAQAHQLTLQPAH
jgi:penicillin amidase